MAAALASAIRNGCSAASCRKMIPGILPHLGSSPVSSGAGMGRLMRPGMIGGSGVRPQEQLMTMGKFNGKRFLGTEPPVPQPPCSFLALGAVSAFGVVMAAIYTGPGTIRTIASLMK